MRSVAVIGFRIKLAVGLDIALDRDRLRADSREVLNRPVVRPGPAIGFRRFLRTADSRKIFVAADPRHDAGSRKVMVIMPWRAPIGAHNGTRLVIIEPHHFAALGLREIADGKISRARGAGDAEPHESDGEQNAHPVHLQQNRRHFIRTLYNAACNREVTLIAAAP